jgi:hypothetical protein
MVVRACRLLITGGEPAFNDNFIRFGTVPVSYFSPPRPFWFVSDELLTNILRAEIDAVTHLLAKCSDPRKSFDSADATVQQRTTCFMLLAHRELIDIVYETFSERWEQSPRLGDAESNALDQTRNLVPVDAPTWVLEMQEVVEHLPVHIHKALPEPLRKGCFGFNRDNVEEMEAIRSATEGLSSVAAIQALTERVLDQQLQRLQGRWSVVQIREKQIVEIRAPHILEPRKRKGRRRVDKQRMLRDRLIAEIDDVAKSVPEFLRLMDERKIKPQPTWNDWPGSWVAAYRDRHLRELIHKDKSRALSRVRTG